MIRVAVLSDPHLHDVGSGNGPGTVVRSLAETIHSTRVFNESEAAFRQVLADIADQSPDVLVIVGDLTDDGQPASWAAVASLLAGFRAAHGIRVFATPGNHDQWAMAGKPLTKDRVDADGRIETLSSDPRPGVTLCAGMRMVGYADALRFGAAFGYMRDPADLHWETPFGRSDRLAERVYLQGDGGPGMIDASYLVEPQKGLWLLSIDANAYRPDGNGGVDDFSKEGWSAALRHKPHLLPWMTDVARRAKDLGKSLVAFSHYPVADIFSGTVAALDAVDPTGGGRRRMPDPGTMAALAGTGIGLHFSGHFHVDATAPDPSGRMLNVAMPSTVAFPAGWKLLEIDGPETRIITHPLRKAPGFDLWADRYRREAARRGIAPPPVIGAPDYPAFLDRHFDAMVIDRRLTEDWPTRMRDLVLSNSLADLTGVDSGNLSMRDVFIDWYRLREAGGGPLAGVSDARRELYGRIADALPGWTTGADNNGLLTTFFTTLGAHVAAGPRGVRTLAEAGIASA